MAELPAPVRVRLFGPPSVGVDADALTAPRRIAVLAYLTIARPRGLHSRDTLAALFWPDSRQEHARHALRNVLHAIRRALGADVVTAAGDGLVGVRHELLDCDVLAFEGLLRANGEAALAMYSGELLQGFHVTEAPDFERWLDVERARLHRAVVDAARSALEAYRLAGDVARAVTVAHRAHEIAPDDEAIVRLLLQLQVDSDDRAAAEWTYDAFRRRLREEYDTAPEAVTTAIMSAPRPAAGAVSRKATTSDAALTLYVRGTYLFLRTAPIGDAAELERCRVFFEEALALDPQFAHAYSGLANYYAVAGIRNIIKPFHAAFARGLEFCRRALELDPRQAIPHVHFGVEAMFLDGNWPRAEEELFLARQLDPTYAEAHKFLGIYYTAMGRFDDAMACFHDAVRIEPHIPLYRNSIADAHMSLGEYEEAIVQLRRGLLLEPLYVAARERLVRCLEKLGRYEEAIAERGEAAARFAVAYENAGAAGYQRERKLEITESITQLAARIAAGPPANASDIFNPPQLRLALWCAELGDLAAARIWMEDACSRRPGQRQWFVGRPELRALRNS